MKIQSKKKHYFYFLFFLNWKAEKVHCGKSVDKDIYINIYISQHISNISSNLISSNTRQNILVLDENALAHKDIKGKMSSWG